MAISPGLLPNPGAPIADGSGAATQEWRDFFLQLADGADSESLRDEYIALAARVSALEDAGTKPVYGANGISVITTPDSVTATLVASLPNLLDVDSSLDILAVEDDGLRFNAATGLWEARPTPSAGIYMPMVTGEIFNDQPVFVYADDGSLIYVQVE